MIYIIAIAVVVVLILFVPPLFLIIGGIVALFIPGLEIIDIAVAVLGTIKLFMARGK